MKDGVVNGEFQLLFEQLNALRDHEGCQFRMYRVAMDLKSVLGLRGIMSIAVSEPSLPISHYFFPEELQRASVGLGSLLNANRNGTRIRRVIL